MIWDDVMERVKTVILADLVLSGIFGENYRKAGVGDLKVPVIEWNLLGNTENELWEPMLVQFDIWTNAAQENRNAERRLRTMFHRPTQFQLEDITMFTEFNDASDLATPNRAGFTGRGIRFRFTPLRQQYALPAH